MGKIMSRIKWKTIKDLIEMQYYEVLYYIDYAMRTLVMGYPDKIFDWIDWQIWEFRARMANNSDNEHADEYCYDKEGLHKVGETWSSRNRCNKKICVAHDTIKELRCPIIPEDHGCSVARGNTKDPYPHCCDELKCPITVNPQPLVRPHKPVWWIYENYIHECSSSSEEELNPHPSTISARVSGLDKPDED